MRTQDEIIMAIKAIKADKETCDEFDFFGVSKYKARDVMIDTLENNRSEEYIYTNYPSCDEDGNECIHAHSLWQAGMTALEFKRGEWKLDDIV